MRREVTQAAAAGVFALAATAAFGGAALAEGQAQIAQRLKDRPECCVIDARGELGRLRAAIPFAIAHTSGVTVKKGAFALLVADTDDAALAAARSVAQRSAGDVIAVNGGYSTLQALGRAATPASASPSRFTIPSNTCEQGEALQEFKR